MTKQLQNEKKNYKIHHKDGTMLKILTELYNTQMNELKKFKF